MQKNFLYLNLANVTSILGVLPLVLLFFDEAIPEFFVSNDRSGGSC